MSNSFRIRPTGFRAMAAWVPAMLLKLELAIPDACFARWQPIFGL
jgi:hypothetical protein